MQLFYRQQDAVNFSTSTLTFNDSLRLFSGAISGEGLSGVVHYYIQVRDMLGREGFSPRGAPMALDSFYVAVPTQQARRTNEIAAVYSPGHLLLYSKICDIEKKIQELDRHD